MAEINQIVDPNDIKNIKDLMDAMSNLDEKLKDVKDTTAKAASTHGEYTKMLNRAVDTNNKLVGTAKELESQNKQLVTTNIKLSQVEGARNKELQKQKIALADANKEIREQIKLENAATGSLNGAKLAWGAFGKSVMAGTGIVKSFTLAVRATGAAIASIPIIGWIAMAVTGLGLMASKLVKNAQEFGTASASLKAITGASAKDMDFMKQKAKEYAQQSTLSATEVLTAFEKIGSAAPQLLKNKEALTEVTKAAITLSESTGGKLMLEDAAKATTAAMNQFNIPASEAGRIINTLAAGSQAGSAEVQDLTASFKNVGAVASGAGMSLEETVAALETLGEKGLYAEEAGTKLRGSILRLQKAGMGYASGSFDLRDALEEVNGKMAKQGSEADKDKLAIKLFGAENITAGKILLDNVGKFDELTAAVTGTNTAYEMATIQTDTLKSSKEKLGNAWSSLMLSIEDGGGILSKIWKGFLDGMTAAMNGISKFIDKFKSKEALERKAAKVAEKEREEEKKATDKLEKETTNVQEVEDKKKIASSKKAAEERKRQINETANLVEKNTESERKRIADQKKDAEELTAFLEEQSMSGIVEVKEKETALLDAMIESTKKNAEIKYRQQVLLVKATSKTEEEAARRIAELDESNLQGTINNISRQLQESGIGAEKKLELETQLAEAQMNLDDAIFERKKSNEEKATELRKAAFEGAVQVGSALFDFFDKGYQNDLTLLEQKNAQGLLSDKEYAKQKAEIEIKQAKANKLKGVFDVSISTAAAIMGMLKDPGGVAGTIMAVAAGITGGLQIASILSTPLPQMPAFLNGGVMDKGYGTVAEDGKRELGILKTGEALMFNRAQFVAGERFKGMHISKNADTEKMMSMTEHSGFQTSDNTILAAKLDSLEKTIKDKPVFIFDKEKNVVGKQVGSHTEMYVNRLKYR
jgi:TP901 family phage tail tape measure protein